MRTYLFKHINIFILIFSVFIFSSCTKDDETPDNAVAANTFFEIEGNEGELTGRGEFVSKYVPEFELHVAGIDIWDNSTNTAANAKFLIGIQIYDEEEIELTEGLYTLRDSYLAGGDLGRMGVGLTWWDEDRSATMYSEVERGFLRIRSITAESIRGDFAFDVKSPATGDVMVVREGRFNIAK